jgi:3-oxoacyl-(acyl-carrier-protein) synthase
MKIILITTEQVVFWAMVLAGLRRQKRISVVWLPKDRQELLPWPYPKLISNEGPANVAIYHGLKGPCFALATACASGTDALGYAMNTIRTGMADIVVSGEPKQPLPPLQWELLINFWP